MSSYIILVYVPITARQLSFRFNKAIGKLQQDQQEHPGYLQCTVFRAMDQCNAAVHMNIL